MIRDPGDLLQYFAFYFGARRERANIEQCEVAVGVRHGDVDHHVEDGHHNHRLSGHPLAV